ncbi:MAG: biotin/lipoyl-binding protein [Planctomycetes bacterium]|nr:biotin/lipoyl-binding protein [Planctomycetota bacterium]
MSRVIALFLVIVGGFIGWLVYEQNRTREFVVSGFIEADEIRVGSRIGGRVALLDVEEGQSLKTGAILFRLDPFNLRERTCPRRVSDGRVPRRTGSIEVGLSR